MSAWIAVSTLSSFLVNLAASCAAGSLSETTYTAKRALSSRTHTFSHSHTHTRIDINKRRHCVQHWHLRNMSLLHVCNLHLQIVAKTNIKCGKCGTTDRVGVGVGVGCPCCLPGLPTLKKVCKYACKFLPRSTRCTRNAFNFVATCREAEGMAEREGLPPSSQF